MATSSALSTSNKYIKYKISVTQNSQSVTKNSSSVTVSVKFYRTNTGYITYGSGTVYCKIDGTKYSASVDSSDKITNSGIVLFSKTLNVAHDSDGAKKLKVSAWIDHSLFDSSEQSFSVNLTTIPRKSSLSVANGTLGTAQALTVTRQSIDFTHTVVATCGESSMAICSKDTDTSLSFTPPLAWASQNTTGTSVSVKYTITTYKGSTSIGSNSYTKTCSIPSSVKPSCSVALSDTTSHLATYGFYIQGMSKIKVQVTATTSYGSEIASYAVEVGSAKYTNASFTVDAQPTSGKDGSFVVSATVKDKRGSSSDSASTMAEILHYKAPTIDTFKVKRCNEDGTDNDRGEFCKTTFRASVTELMSESGDAVLKQNVPSYTLSYKKATEEDYTNIPLDAYAESFEIAEGIYIFPADSGSSYSVKFTVEDDFYNGEDAIALITNLSTGFTIMHWLASGLGMALGKIAELAGVLDIGFQTRFMGGILHPVLEPNTDLNQVMTPNTYVGANLSTHNYTCGGEALPLSTGTFSLEVVGMGEEGQVKQRLSYCNKTQSRAWERFYYGGAWGDWICVSDFDGQLLWSGAYYMDETQTVNLSEPISRQKNGVVLVFSSYTNGSANDFHFQCFFVPKYQVALHSGLGHNFFMVSTSNFGKVGCKYLYIYDEKIVGNENNDNTGTANGITYTNTYFVLRHVIGV